jgi:hypothetical protein
METVCKLASFVVTRERVLWHPESDSHEQIIEKYGLDDKKKSDFVRVELVPPNNDYLKPLNSWVYQVNQDNVPSWYNTKESEIATRHELDRWRKKRQWFFDAMDFVATIKDTPWYTAKKKPLKAWRVFDTRDAARDAAGNAAGDAAGDAARDAARNAARNAAADAAWNAARDAAWDACLFANLLVLADKTDVKYLKYAKQRWAVWKAGYGLLCDVHGVLYVYKHP